MTTRSVVLPDVLQSATSPKWVEVALADFDAVLTDHAHCEKKAASSAMALVNSYPELSELVRRCVKLAQEELRHFQQVHQIILRRGGTLGKDHGDPYAQALLKCMRHGPLQRRMDRLLVCSLIEARSCERLALLGEGLEDPQLANFYKGLAGAEAGHHRLFVDLAARYHPPAEVEARLRELAQREAAIVAELPVAPRIH